MATREIKLKTERNNSRSTAIGWRRAWHRRQPFCRVHLITYATTSSDGPQVNRGKYGEDKWSRVLVSTGAQPKNGRREKAGRKQEKTYSTTTTTATPGIF